MTGLTGLAAVAMPVTIVLRQPTQVQRRHAPTNDDEHFEMVDPAGYGDLINCPSAQPILLSAVRAKPGSRDRTKLGIRAESLCDATVRPAARLPIPNSRLSLLPCEYS
ncbi:hypothetical protein [Sphingomonas sp. CFBP 8760]|uniref:hypothetical protein n=1 Tax=Sphingomonas sp. CFBP 8760 TaxID=2775282 RepID=UPI00177CD2F3|nr:hypothetical protein [Sphingomonas sp. CFBP 8760]MBD8548562.1 hypothetical protein [Sphingomonas sp. CFBP 8760]